MRTGPKPLPSPVDGADLCAILAARAWLTPDRLAFRYLVDGEDEEALVTYGELDRRARSVAACLAAHGARGERALLLHAPGLDYVESLLGCFYAGVVAVPAYPPRFDRSMARLRALARDAGARFALTTPPLHQLVLQHPEGGLSLEGVTWITSELQAEGGPPFEPAPGVDGALALLQYTSGSTSEPKGVMLSQRHLVANARQVIERARLTAEDRGVSWLPPYHDMGLVGAIVVPLVAGFETTLLSPLDFLQRPLRWLRALSRQRATVSVAPNFAFDLCVRRATAHELPELDLRRVRAVLCGAERVRPETLERFARTFAPAGFDARALLPAYGLAEATVGVTLRTPGAPALVRRLDEKALGAGRVEDPRGEQPAVALSGCGAPLAESAVAIVDPVSLAARAPGEVGEIWVRGPAVASGFWGQPELSERTFRAQVAGAGPLAGLPFLRTGDLGFLADGELFVSGRLKDLVILRGQNHYPEDLEATAAKAHPRLRPGGGIAFAVERAGEERLVLVHEVDKPGDLPAQEIAAAVRALFAGQHDAALDELVLLAPGTLPKTSSGKVQRALCKQLYLQGALPALAVDRPGGAQGKEEDADDERLQLVCAAAASVLGLTQVGPDDDFFALGGHSLLATQLVSRLRAELRCDLALRTLFEAPTPRALVRRLPARGLGPLPALPAQPAQRAPGAPLRLSASQERMWYLHQLQPLGAAYNVAAALSLEGPLDVPALEQALAGVIARHDVLRTNYLAVDGVPQAVLRDSLPLQLPVTDLTPSSTPDGDAAALATALARAPFDLARDPLVRARLLRTGPARHALAVCFHHIVADGWSLGVLLTEVLEAYGALRAGHAPAVRAPQPGYFDYVAWHRAQSESTRRAQLEWWTAQLAGAPLLELPTDRPRRPQPPSAGALEPLSLPPELTSALRALAQAEGATLFMAMLAAFAVVLQRLSGQADLVLGIPIANRNWLAAEGVVGTLVNTLPLRLRVDPEASFSKLLHEVREACLEAYARQEVPLEQLVANLHAERRPGRSPLFSVLFDFLNFPSGGREAHGLRLSPIVFSRLASQVDLMFSVVDTGLGHQAGVEYDTDLFEAATIRRLLDAYVSVARAVAADPHERVSQLPLLSPEERARLLARASAACVGEPPRGPVIDWIEAQAARTPDAVAVTDQEGALTYRALDEAANALAWRLRRAGVGPGKRVALCLDRSRAVVVAVLAALKLRAPYVPIDPRYPASRVAFVLQDSAPAVLVTGPALRDRLPLPARLPVVCLGPADLAQRAPRPEPEPRAAEEAEGEPLAYVLYTSGSTGHPKGVEITGPALANFLLSMRARPGLSASDRLLSVTTISFDIAGLELLLPLVCGASVELAPQEAVADGARLSALLAESGATVMQATPATWRLLLEAGWKGDGRLKILCGGEALPRDLADRLLACGGEVWNLYGPTETTIWSALARVEPGEGPVPLGRPIAHTRLYVLGPRGELVPDLVAGEIFIGGAGVARGYLRRPELTAGWFVADPFAGGGARMYRTGDGGRFRTDGALEYLGRLDHQLKVRGHRIEPGEVEAALHEHPGVQQAVVVAREDLPGDVRLVAYVTAREPDPLLSGADLRELCRRTLPEHLVPSAVVVLPQLPLTPNGKLDRAALPAPAAGVLPPAREPGVPPRDDLERELARIWSALLGAPVTDVRTSFFDLGGHSLLAARLLGQIERQVGVHLPLAAMVEQPTIEHLAELVRRRARRLVPASQPRSLLELSKGGARPPLFCVHGAGGFVFNLHEVARHLSPSRPLYGLQARGAEGLGRPAARIEQMATDYLAEVRARQPHGPYWLSGYCGGGVVAWEMAQQLRKAGEEVALLLLIDTPAPRRAPAPSRLGAWLAKVARSDVAHLWAYAVGKHRRDSEELLLTLRLAWRRLRGLPVPFALRDRWLTRAYVRAAESYTFEPYPGPVVLLRARAQTLREPEAAASCWESLARGGLAAYDLPGDHHTLFQGDNARALSAQLEACLESAEKARL
jgi:amino acid adenylation domain-containing protein